MKKILFICLLVANSVIFAGSHSFLFIQKAEKGNLHKNKDGSYSLTLKDFPQHVSYFSNRPAHIAGILPLQKFLTVWSNPAIANNFSKEPPNVAIAMITKRGYAHTLIGSISSPKYKNNTISYAVKAFNKFKGSDSDLSYVELFFDDIHWNPGGFGN